ncbi:hypothetical protein J2T02_000913 [Chitinophaga terrae (ex Kim and Jung 2007)]|uniref:hypothetical protein n=1 Tax=Chitinophaga terrae (ex Kim and Jung 2007) TaxID=408074 RepID=UPI00277F6CAF|nr:hypothetical protein [Chitinophaga terrae (ex Kim and Jung 2007)]MDQ0105819.1 hypothetical protein [Chitinophaga terrae (ex Kim and Jung 2007)]
MNTIFEKSNYTQLWQAIASGDLDKAREKLRDTEYIPVRLAAEVLSSSPLGDNFTLSLKANGESQFTDLVRLLAAVYENGNFPEQANSLRLITIEQLTSLASEVMSLAEAFTDRPVTPDIWFYGVVLREWCNTLIDLFTALNIPRAKAAVWQNKSKITCAVMSHYPHFVGPDMVATAEILEEVDEKDLAKQYAQAVLGDFERFIANTAEQATLEDIISLTALKDAYVLLGRIDQTDQYADKLKIVEERIDRGIQLKR